MGDTVWNQPPPIYILALTAFYTNQNTAGRQMSYANTSGDAISCRVCR
jgi:hypothetical protein